MCLHMAQPQDDEPAFRILHKVMQLTASPYAHPVIQCARVGRSSCSCRCAEVNAVSHMIVWEFVSKVPVLQVQQALRFASLVLPPPADVIPESHALPGPSPIACPLAACIAQNIWSFNQAGMLECTNRSFDQAVMLNCSSRRRGHCKQCSSKTCRSTCRR